MILDKGLAKAMFDGMNSHKSIAAIQKIFVLWMKDGVKVVTGENLLGEMMKYKPAKITRIK
ncbi:MAG: hypothetical protein OIN83_11720 [Candidatus Methanoperedens sp.]|nr:hypothetical protein [Candidatus Methanoperedens sp.]